MRASIMQLGSVALCASVFHALGERLEDLRRLHGEPSALRIGAPFPAHRAVARVLGRDELPAERELNAVGGGQGRRLCRSQRCGGLYAKERSCVVKITTSLCVRQLDVEDRAPARAALEPVSYTHLTLPTSDLV